MNATIAALFGSLIGAGTGLAGSVLSSAVALKNARQSEKSNARTGYIHTLRERSGTTFAQFFIMCRRLNGLHGMASMSLRSTKRRLNRTTKVSIVLTRPCLVRWR
jgi:hypothetical protein